MLAVVRDTWDYVQQMIPLGLIALMILLLLRPMRKRRLKEQNLVSSLWRETALLLFLRGTGCVDPVSRQPLGLCV